MSSSQDIIRLHIQNIMSKTEIEGRLEIQTNGRLVLYDCPHWSHKASSLLFYQYPNIIISINQCNSSISGFVVVFEEKSQHHARLRMVISLILAFIILFTLYVYYNRYALWTYVHDNYLYSIFSKKKIFQFFLHNMHFFESFFN